MASTPALRLSLWLYDWDVRRRNGLAHSPALPLYLIPSPLSWDSGGLGGGPLWFVEAWEVVRNLESHTNEFWLWWTPSHAVLLKNDLVDEAAKAVAQDLASVDVCEAPLCKATLKTQIAGHY